MVIRCFSSSINTCTPKLVFGRGPGPRWGAYDAPPDSLVGWEGGHPLPYLSPRQRRRLDLGVFGASIKIPGYAYGRGIVRTIRVTLNKNTTFIRRVEFRCTVESLRYGALMALFILYLMSTNEKRQNFHQTTRHRCIRNDARSQTYAILQRWKRLVLHCC